MNGEQEDGAVDSEEKLQATQWKQVPMMTSATLQTITGHIGASPSFATGEHKGMQVYGGVLGSLQAQLRWSRTESRQGQ